MKRRQFLTLSSGAAMAVANAHFLFNNSFPANSLSNENKSPLIKGLKLETASPLSTMRTFYEKTIGLNILAHSSKELTIQAGQSTITFIQTSKQDYRPFYHFAFNIPENKIYKAMEWQKKRTPLVNPRPNIHRDPMKDVSDFSHWNAHAIFFLDPAGNLVEYIARHDLKNGASGDFSVRDILYESEIGFIVSDVLAAGNHFLQNLNLKEYRPGSDGFWPIGDEHGLLLMIGQGVVWSGHPGQTNKTDIFDTQAIIDHRKREWKLAGYPYEVLH